MADRISFHRYCTLPLTLLLSTVTLATAFGDCDPSTDIDLKIFVNTYFLYCPKQDSPWIATEPFDHGLCSSLSQFSRVKLEDVLVSPEAKGNSDEKKCQAVNNIRYHKQRNCSGDATLVKPFLEKFSWKRPTLDAVKELSWTSKPGGIVAYQYKCESDTDTIDMCQQNTSFFEAASRLKFLFKPNSLGTSSNCYCYVTSSDARIPIEARAMDVRLDEDNKLLFDSEPLREKKYYWWRDGVLNSGFSQISLLNVDQKHMPARVWMEISGFNLSVSCDVKPLDVPGGQDRFGPGSSPSSAGFNLYYIVGIVVGIVVLLIVMFLMMHCIKQRGKKHEEEDAEMEEYDMGQQMSETSTGKQEEEILLTTQVEVEYSTPTKIQSRNAGKSIEMYDKPHEHKELVNENEDGAWLYESQDSDNADSPECLSQDDVSRNNAATGAIYSHLNEKPDIVLSSPSNIYDTTGKDDYSHLDRNPQPVLIDNTYDA